jgi:hypothetical protein
MTEYMNKQTAIDVMNKYSMQLLRNDEVVGIGLGKTKEGQYCIRLYVENDTTGESCNLPEELDCIKVEIIVTGKIELL